MPHQSAQIMVNFGIQFLTKQCNIKWYKEIMIYHHSSILCLVITSFWSLVYGLNVTELPILEITQNTEATSRPPLIVSTKNGLLRGLTLPTVSDNRSVSAFLGTIHKWRHKNILFVIVKVSSKKIKWVNTKSIWFCTRSWWLKIPKFGLFWKL